MLSTALARTTASASRLADVDVARISTLQPQMPCTYEDVTKCPGLALQTCCAHGAWPLSYDPMLNVRQRA